MPPHHSVESFAQAIRAIGEPIHNRTADEISMAKLLTLLFEVTGLFDMRTRPELLLLQKTMVVVEGVARSLDPKLDMWTTAEPVVREWIERHLGPAGRLEDAARARARSADSSAACRRCSAAPRRSADQLDAATRDGLVLAPETVAAIGAGRGAAQPLDRRGAVGDRRAAGGGDLEDGMIALIAMQSCIARDLDRRMDRSPARVAQTALTSEAT